MSDATFDDDNTPLPCAQELVACTVALMTAHADAVGPHRAAGQRALLARKVVANLYVLQHHPDIGSGLRMVMSQAHRRWVNLARPEEAAPPGGGGESQGAAQRTRAVH